MSTFQFLVSVIMHGIKCYLYNMMEQYSNHANYSNNL